MDRQERRRRTARIVARRKEVMRWSGMLKWADDRYLGRCKTLHPLDCGRPRCGVCSLGRKLSGITRQEEKAKLAQEENMTETTEPHKFVGYMCGTDFFDEEGRPWPSGNQVFATVDHVRKERPCAEKECGIAEVEVKFKKWIVPPSGPNENNNLRELAEKARRAGEIARNKTGEVRRMEEAARASDRAAYFRDVVEAERNAKNEFANERFKG